MRKPSIRIMTALVGVVLSFAGVMQAQYVPHYVKVSIPFEFSVGGKLLPAGDYKLACTPTEVELRDARGQVVASTIHHAVQTADTPVAAKVVFVTEGGGHALRQVWPGTTNYGYELTPYRSVNVMARQHSKTPVQLAGGGNK
jgi:hypothetical protein